MIFISCVKLCDVFAKIRENASNHECIGRSGSFCKLVAICCGCFGWSHNDPQVNQWLKRRMNEDVKFFLGNFSLQNDNGWSNVPFNRSS